MNVKPHNDFHACVPGAFQGGLTRTAFFDGMILTEADMLREQGYWAMKRRLTNRALGQGVVWGLNVVWDHKSRCFTLCPGYGISCCGDDLVVECPEKVCEGDLIDPCSEDFRRLLANAADPCNCDPDTDGPIEACLYLEYVECPEEARQVFEDPCAPDHLGCRYGAVRETTRLRLVPPPPPEPASPIERFCEKIEQIRGELTAAGVAMPEFYVGASEPEMAIEIGATDPDGDQVAEGAKLELELDATAQASIAVDPGGQVAMSVMAPPGYVFTQALEGDVDISGMDTLMQVALTRTAAQLMQAPEVETVTLEMTPVLSPWRPRQVTLRVEGTGSGTTATMNVRVTGVEVVERRTDCLSAFADGFRLSSGDMSCTLKTLALSVLIGWFQGQLGSAACAPDREEGADQSRLLLAWVVAWLAWQMLFGIDIRDDRAQGAMRCLRKLFQEWCDEMQYKGPRCDTHLHGIFLGCVEISPKGKILCFDAWKHRRYVLTGPLLTHWGSQFGLAPIDVVAGRLARWICCVAGVEMERPELGDFAQADGSFDFLGAALASYGSASRTGRQIESSREVGLSEFVKVAMSVLQGGTPRVPENGYAVYGARGLGLELAVPAASGGVAALREQSSLRAVLVASSPDAPPLALSPANDLAEAVAENISLAELKDPNNTATFAPMTAALEKAGIATPLDLIAAGPEVAVARARPFLEGEQAATSAEATMNRVYKAATTTVVAAHSAVAEHAKGRSEDEPFLRADLVDTDTVAAIRREVNKTLKGRGIATATAREIAAEAAARQP